ncbi:hypothetical protein NG895_17920 [Aeoliella sp. ICT_H6.2]|uniref:Uncharacterized protein n=1 Tax=Aeoliella straminimaris TaxID=2954799 RepID=A0A9X2JK30_9BACT|nr:hypothetical protein [Aeoliella straminimaris]MCO6045779.1 hypothetical protein [Aeoliella straminimaris]
MTDPAATTDDDGRTSASRLGPFSLAVVAAIVLTDVIALLPWNRTLDETRVAVFLGFMIGQAGALPLWTFAAGIRYRLLMAVGSLAGASLIAVLFAYWVEIPDLDDLAILVLMFLVYALAILLSMLLIHSLRSRTDLSTWQPRFVVRQLLGVMIVTALIAATVRLALPAIDAFGDIGNLAPLFGWSVTAITAGVLLLNHPPSLWRLGAFAGIGLAIGYLCTRLTSWDEGLYANVVQMTTLAVCLVVPQFDRYVLRVALEPRERSDPEQHLDENA